MPILSEKDFLDLFIWIENKPAKGFIDITQHQPHRINKLSVWVHDLRDGVSVAPASSTLEKHSPSGSSPHTTIAAFKPRVRPLFRPLNNSELDQLKQDPSTSLWPKPKWIFGSWLPQHPSEMTNNLQDAIGHLNGCAPVTPILLNEKGFRNVVKRNPYSFLPPYNMALDEEYRADRIMRGFGSPNQNLKGERQHWNAKNWLVTETDSHMGAVIEMYGVDSSHTTGIDVCEIQALIILLDRQVVLRPQKQKLKAWLVSVQMNRGFRALEAWLDQSVNEYEFHFAVVDERGWPRDSESHKTIDGSTDEWKWLLSYVLAQSID